MKNLPARQETLVWSLVEEDPLERGKVTVFLPEESHGQRNLVYGVVKSQTLPKQPHMHARNGVEVIGSHGPG